MAQFGAIAYTPLQVFACSLKGYPVATIIQRGPGQYLVEIRKAGYRRVSKTFETLAAAQTFAIENEADHRMKRFVDLSLLERTTVGEIIKRFREMELPKRKSITSISGRLSHWERLLGSRFLATLTTREFFDWSETRTDIDEVQPMTARRDLMDLQAVFAYARTRLQIPIPDILAPVFRTLPQGGYRRRRLSAQEEARLFAEARQYSPMAASLIEFALETGMRRGEIAGITWAHVLLREQIISLTDAKNGDSRRVPLSARAEEILRALPRTLTGPIFGLSHPDAITRMFTRICTRAGIADLRFRDLRREAASRIAPHVAATTLARIFGWRTPRMALRCYNPKARELVAAVRRAEAARAAA